jgi:ubiquinone/menaquinone biosynthesis C-methylase UbiE
MEKVSADKQAGELPMGAKFHENLASAWSDGYFRGSFGRRRSFFLPILDCNVISGQRWIDLGCGSGVLTKELLSRGASVLAIDGSPNMLNEARKNVTPVMADMLTWLHSDVEHLIGVADKTFDGILCSSVIEYVQDPDALLSEAYRVLHAGGKLIISMPPTFSFVRTVQKVMRRIAALFGREHFSYLGVSKFEIDPGKTASRLIEKGFVMDRMTPFDPKLPNFALSFLRPALLIVEAHKQTNT